MGFLEEYDVNRLNNETEDVLFEKLYEIIEKRKNDMSFPQFCICQTCILDIAAIALNKLPPHYRLFSTDTTHAIKHLKFIDPVNIETELLTAIKIVMASPHHY